ncbi:hypothetical protein SAMN05421743_10830 [Thalassobacillus cyri]|uniref:Uncharacterized protein n=1 Tax=Thalassobacillus cyri TaxID=571932 RepID=A0A1H4DW25_9BACI|nr:hypothetical protein SAMN05421743_10830 [Thalassobacillus cyri]
MSKFKSSIILLIVLSVLFISFLSFNLFGINNTKGEELKNSLEFSLNKKFGVSYKSDDSNLEFAKKEESTYIKAENMTMIYNLKDKGEKLGELHLTKRTIDNGDVFLFTRLNNMTEKRLEGKLTLTLPQSIKQYDLKDFDRMKNRAGLTTYPSALIRFYNKQNEKGHLMISKNYLSAPMQKGYENGNVSKVRHLLSEDENIKIQRKKENIKLVIDFETTSNTISEQWILLSNKKLFKEEKNINYWIKKNNEHGRRINTWYTDKGPYSKMPKSVEPQTEDYMAYGRKLLMFKEEEILLQYKKTKERYFYDLLINSLVNLEQFRGDNKYWPTEVTSTWLKRSYGIKAPFIDTRFNERIALYLRGVREEIGIDNQNKEVINYADLLLKQQELNNVIKVKENAFYIPDYFSMKDNKITHTSLNHQLGGLQILLSAYVITGDKKYLNVARQIQNALDEQKDDWLTAEGDTWYKVMPDLQFGGEDYQMVTLRDLLNTIDYWRNAGQELSPIYEKFIRSKVNYLKSVDAEFSQEVVKLMKKEKYYYLIKRYPHISKY